jgi:hypothetical protein
MAGCALVTAGLAPSLCGSDTSPGRWPYEVTTGMYRIHADFELTASSELITELNQVVSDVIKLLNTAVPSTPLHMVLFDKPEEYRRYLTHYFPKAPDRRALFIKQRGTSMLLAHRHADMTTDLRHESVHAVLNDAPYSLPLWLDEGLAEYFEVAREQRWSGHPHLAAVQQRIARDLPDLEALESLDKTEAMTADHYRDAWAWVHFLMHRRQTTRTLLVDQIDTRRRARSVLSVSRIVELQIPKWRDEITEHFKAVA